MIATVLGISMLLAGTIVAAAERPEAALVWAGAVIAAVGLVGDRLLKFQVGCEGATIEFASKQARVAEAIKKAKEEGPAAVSARITERVPTYLPVSGTYWSAPAIDRLVIAFGSDTRYQFDEALE